MNRPIFCMLVGLPCSGKSTKAVELAKKYNANIHSSDAIREELTGDINNQENNALVFRTLHQRVKDDLKGGKSCIYDACCVHYKERMAFLQELKNIPCEKICVLMATPYETCLERSAKRDRKVPEHVIKRMYTSFDVPWYYEGWDQIEVEYCLYSEGSLGWTREWTKSVAEYDQHNSHHALTLGQHCDLTAKYIEDYAIEHSVAECDNLYALKYAALIHDCGKPFCKTFKNSKGEITEQAHYYNHERTGSYDSLFYYMFNDVNLRVAVLIRWHMQPYFWEKDNNEKLHNKHRRLWGEELYNDIMHLHEADKAAH